MTVAISNTSFSTSGLSSLKKTLSVNRASGEGLLIGVWYRGLYGDPYDGISTVKWDPTGDNQSFTLLRLQRQNGTTRYLAVYYLPAPTSVKTANIEVTFVTGNDVDDCAILARHITGHKTSVAARASTTYEGTISSATSPATHSITSVATDLVVDFFSHRYDVGFVGYSAGQGDAALYSSAGGNTLASTSKAGATAVNMGWSSGQTDAEFDYGHVLVTLEQAAGGSTVTVNGSVGVADATGKTATLTISGPTTVAGIIGVANATGLTAASVNTYLVTDAFLNNTETGPLASVAVVYTWTPSGRIGSMSGLTPQDGTGTTNAQGRLVTTILKAAGRLDVAVRNSNATTDDVFYQAYT